ncbi:hypothetical protein ECANGB1_2119 [Enterospora canceri]|uniref:Uncharacterized protein n=1 Tax=Enterospora canceri TaxID=1081671 RepID=A0A1Y1S3T1_9MICR|nr:hypothetical protein ECANGB1_2119 [Enterospora canceri]
MLYLLLFLHFAGGLNFAGIVQERVGVVFLMTIFMYTFLGFFTDFFASIGSTLNIDGAWVQALVAFLFCAAFLVFYKIVKPLFLVYNGIVESLAQIPFIFHFLVLIGIIIAVKMLFKVFESFYKYILVAVFSIYGSLMVLCAIFGLIGLPLNFDDYLGKFIDQQSLIGPMVESWNTLVWIMFIAAGAVAQVGFIRKGK